jgi:glycyl-tRNA synthetase beta chain
MATLLLELFSEEIPSRMQKGAAEQLERLMLDGFKKHALAPTRCKTFVSPRHLAIQCFGLPTIQPDMREEKRGPKIGAPEQAMKGFLSASGLTLEQCEQRDGYYYATIERKGRAVAAVAKEICESALASFGWPKSMHWGSRDARPVAWVRPLHRIACLLDDAVVPVQFAHLTAGNLTEGHRFMAPAPITITHAEQYEPLLKDAKVVVDYAARGAQIKTEIAALAAAANLMVAEDDELLNEVTGLVEWPVPLLCQFDKKFLDLPPEVLISEMKNHQRYFALKSADGKLSDQFITVANMVTADGGAKVKEGNARVVRARLADGEFYWEQDRKTSLEDWGKKLSDVVFHAKVGMMNEKVARIETLAVEIAKAVGYTNEPAVRRAAKLCKADLTSGMVGEFPELQGIMGRYYATAQGESAEIADAIRDHYKPLGASDSVPESPLAAIIAIADKLDSITSLFAAGEKPTGSKDPLALRRAALGIVRIMLYHNWGFDLASRGASPEVSEFLRERLKVLLRDENIRHDAVDAVFAKTIAINPPVLVTHIKALAAWLTTDAGTTTLAAIKRAMNILAAEEKKSKTTFAAGFSDKLTSPAEKALVAALKIAPKSPADLDALAAPIQQFFTDHMVNDENPAIREARLSLLAAVRDAANAIADFSKIEG